ncbi:penicillin-binding protein activator LpoB [Methylobacter sp.]|uniref:penicillin-binding protein activator LpoB n=2 Tax=Methylobacter sp. TaxID=2051955 RepID=UPI002488E0DA|nr:penicillin-binding protein activator LpoB [Methylobacter sp.]MDI1277878.1 penicillin-binding protein activator LpoB [Methylobacter sp.]MDI1358647.1 penicillin-binding protein activator LpoB [Methylobacter sp.]
MYKKNIMNSTTFKATAIALLLSGCATQSPTLSSGNVEYGDSKAVETLTNEFGSTDLQSIAESMASSLLQSPALFAKSRPLVTVAEVKNRTSEYIDTKSVTDSIRTKIVKSGMVRFAVDTSAMQTQVDELTRQNQTGLYKKSKSKKMGNMEGADFRIEGTITSIVKRAGDVKDVYYKFSLQLVDIESGTMEWADEKEIRKTSNKSMF